MQFFDKKTGRWLDEKQFIKLRQPVEVKEVEKTPFECPYCGKVCKTNWDLPATPELVKKKPSNLNNHPIKNG